MAAMLLRLVAAVGAILTVLAGPGPSAVAAPTPPLVVVLGPGQHDATGRAKNALRLASRRRGSVLLDLTSKPAPPPRARIALSRGIDAYVKLRYDDAIKQLGRGIAEARRTGAAGLSPSALSDLFLYRGLAHTRRGDAASAWDDFVRAATIAPSRTLDPVRFPPRVVEAFDRAVKRVTAKSPLTTRVAVAANCKVHVDGRSVQPRQAVSLARGHHYVRAVCPGYAPYGARVAVLANNHDISPSLQRPVQPTRAQLLAMARARGTGAIVIATVAVSATAPPSLGLELVDARTARTLGTVFAPLTGDDVTARVVTATEGLIDRVVTPQAPVKPRIVHVIEPRRWYQKGWVWAIAGAVVTAAVLTPLLLDSGGPGNQFTLQPGGSLPW